MGRGGVNLSIAGRIAARALGEIALGVLLALFLRRFVCMLVRVKGRSMRDALEDGEFLLALRYGLFGRVRRFDVVICRYPGRKGYFVKRVVGLPGERISMEEGTLLIDGAAVAENFPCRRALRGFEERILGPDEYFVLGDNRPCSSDSRRVGPIRGRAIVARVCCVFLPLKSRRRIPRGNVISSRGD